MPAAHHPTGARAYGDYRDSDAYKRSAKVRPDTGEPLWPLGFVDRPARDLHQPGRVG